MFSPRSPDMLNYAPGAIYAQRTFKSKVLEENNKRMMQIRKLKFKHSQPDSMSEYMGIQVITGQRRINASSSTDQPNPHRMLFSKKLIPSTSVNINQTSLESIGPISSKVAGTSPTSKLMQHRYNRGQTVKGSEESLPELHKRTLKLLPIPPATGVETVNHLIRVTDEQPEQSILIKVEDEAVSPCVGKDQLFKQFVQQKTQAAQDGLTLLEGKGGRGKIREDTLQDVIQSYKEKSESNILKLTCFKTTAFKEHKKLVFISFEGLLGYRAANTDTKSLFMIMQSLNAESLQLNANQLVFASGTDKFLKSLSKSYNVILIMENCSNFMKEISHNLSLKYSDTITAIYAIKRLDTGACTGGYRRTPDAHTSFVPPLLSFANLDDNLTQYLDRATTGQLGSSASGTQIAGRSELIFLFPLQMDVDYLKLSIKNSKDKTVVQLEAQSLLRSSYPWIPYQVKEQVLGITSLFVQDLRFRPERVVVSKRDPKELSKVVQNNFDQLQLVMGDLAEPQGLSLVNGYSLSLLPSGYKDLHSQLKSMVLSDLNTVAKIVLGNRRPEVLLSDIQPAIKDRELPIGSLSSQQIESQNSKFRERYYTRLDGMKLKDEQYGTGSELIRNNALTLTKVCQQPCEYLHSDEYDAYLKDSKAADLLTAQHPFVQFLTAGYDTCFLVD